MCLNNGTQETLKCNTNKGYFKKNNRSIIQLKIKELKETLDQQTCLYIFVKKNTAIILYAIKIYKYSFKDLILYLLYTNISYAQLAIK